MLGGKALDKKIPGRNIRATLKRLGLERPGLGWYEATRHTFAAPSAPGTYAYQLIATTEGCVTSNRLEVVLSVQ